MFHAPNRIMGLVRLVAVNMRLVNVRLAARVIAIPLFRTVICKTAKVVWTVTIKPNTKSKSILVTDLWTAEIWEERQEPRPANPVMLSNMTTASLVRIKENTRLVRPVRFVNMRNVPVCGILPIVKAVTSLIVPKRIVFVPVLIGVRFHQVVLD